jgi:hypothetical protein
VSKRRWIAFLAATLLVGGCGRVTRENYEKIEVGMTLEQVEGFLGRGETKVGGGAAIADLAASAQIIQWGGEAKCIKVTVLNGKVLTKLQRGL